MKTKKLLIVFLSLIMLSGIVTSAFAQKADAIITQGIVPAPSASLLH